MQFISPATFCVPTYDPGGGHRIDRCIMHSPLARALRYLDRYSIILVSMYGSPANFYYIEGH